MKRTLVFTADYHTHTRHSHGRGTVAQNARVAKRRGLARLAVTDHGPANLFGVGVRHCGVYEEIRKEAEEAMRLFPGLQILTGAEANVISREGEIDIPPEVAKKLDILLVGLHIMVRPKVLPQAAYVAGVNLLAALQSRAGRGSRVGRASRADRAALVANTDALVAAIYRHRVHIVTHPGYRLPIDTKELARACAARGTAMEINTGHHGVTASYVRTAFAAGARLVINSDAHEPERVGDLAGGLALLREAAVPPEAVLNLICRTES
ncbi:MAG TPA: PHP domain-containing protein [Firmicutes bacterium]|nr:PHP domain-containing protein [Bacillota bacterium]